MRWLAAPLCETCRGGGYVVLFDYSHPGMAMDSVRPSRRLCGACNGVGRKPWFVSVAERMEELIAPITG